MNIDDFVIAILVLIFIVISISIIKDWFEEEQKTELKQGTKYDKKSAKIIEHEAPKIYDATPYKKITEDKSETKRKLSDTKSDDRQRFLKNQEYLRYGDKKDPEYSKILFETGLLYERLYNDYFRGACYLYLSTLLDKDNEMIEEQYIRLCKLVRNKNGGEWEYCITLVRDISDIDKYIDKLMKQKTVPQQRTGPKKDTGKHYQKSIVTNKKKMNKSKFENFNAESYLHSLGYKVGATGLEVNQRRKLLKKVLSEGKISKYDVIETLERNISMFGHRQDRKKAVADWQEDLRYIRNNF